MIIYKINKTKNPKEKFKQGDVLGFGKKFTEEDLNLSTKPGIMCSNFIDVALDSSVEFGLSIGTKSLPMVSGSAGFTNTWNLFRTDVFNEKK